MRDTATRRQRAVALAPAVAAVLILRARFLVTPLSADEGGYLGVARAWSRGADLYDAVWVDRPQGLMVLYRALAMVGLGTPVGVRLLAVAACLLAAVAAGSIGATLVGERARWSAALAVAVLASVPQFEGFIANAELLSGAVGALCLAMALAATWHQQRPRLALLLVAGVAGGTAILIKQSGFDALVAAGTAVLVLSVRRRWLAALPVLVAGVAIPLGLAALHGALTGWDRWWFAVVGYRLDQRSVLEGADFDRFWTTFGIARPILAPALVVVIVAAVALVRQRTLPAFVLLLGWLLVAVAAFAVGGQFFRHYWIIITIPFGTLVGTLIGLIERRAVAMGAMAVACVAPVIAAADAIVMTRDEVALQVHDDFRLRPAEEIAQWFDAHRSPGDRIYALCVDAAVYGNSRHADPPYPYLWTDGVRNIPGAAERMVAMLESPDGPRFVAVTQYPQACGAGVADALDAHYHPVGVAAGVVIQERDDPGA